MLKGRTHWPVIAGVVGAVICSFLLFYQVRQPGFEATTITVYQWISTGAGMLEGSRSQSWFEINFRIDALTVVMLMTVTFVAALVVIYSRDYMRHHDHPERGYERFFAFLGLFVFAMCSLVLAGNFLFRSRSGLSIEMNSWTAHSISASITLGRVEERCENRLICVSGNRPLT